MNPFLLKLLYLSNKNLTRTERSLAIEVNHICRALWPVEVGLMLATGRAMGFYDSEGSPGTGSRWRKICKVVPHYGPALPSL